MARRLTMEHARPVWSDRREYWPCIADAAVAVDRARTEILAVIDKPGHVSAGREWTSVPPAWWNEREVVREADPVVRVRAAVLGGPRDQCRICGRGGGHWLWCPVVVDRAAVLGA